MEKTYLGDGVYASVDGIKVALTTDNGFGYTTNTIYLEAGVIKSLLRFFKDTGFQYKGL